MADDVRIARWDLLGSAGTTVSLEFTSPDPLTSLAVYTGGTVTDVDDLTDATAHTATLSGGDLVATVEVSVHTGRPVPLRLVVNGAVQSVGQLHASSSGSSTPDNTITLSPGTNTFDLTVLGVVADTDSVSQAELDDETTARIAADSAEAVTRAAADNALSDLISTEQTVRADADTALDGRLDVIEADYLQAADLASVGTLVLDEAETTVAQSGITGTAVDLTGLSITFTVTTRPVLVEVHLPWLTTSAATTNAWVSITDEANAVKSTASASLAVASAIASITVQERITAPGTYTRKVRLQKSGTGNVGNGFNAATVVSRIRATEQ